MRSKDVTTQEFMSDEEKYFQAWLDEAKGEGLVESYKYQPKPFTLFNKVAFQTLKKNGKVDKENVLLKEHTYQADFYILWTPKAYQIDLVRHLTMPDEKGIFISNMNSRRSLVDVKGDYGLNKNDMRFPLNQKWVYDKWNLYVQKIVPFGPKNKKSCLFNLTWTPSAYAFRERKDKKGHLTCYVENIRMIDEYLNQ